MHHYHSLFSGVKIHKSGITIEIYHSINAEQGQITVYTIYETNNFHVMKSCDIVFQFFKILGGGGGGGLMVGWTDEPHYFTGRVRGSPFALRGFFRFYTRLYLN